MAEIKKMFSPSFLATNSRLIGKKRGMFPFPLERFHCARIEKN